MRNRVVLGVALAVVCLVVVPHLIGIHAGRTIAATGIGSGRRLEMAPAEVVPTEVAPAEAPVRVLPPALLHPAPVSIGATGFWSWALIDRRTGLLSGSPNFATTNVTASMIKAWLAADYLRRSAETGRMPAPAVMRQLSVMIRNSDNEAASVTWRAVGRAASIQRLVAICGLTDSRPYIDWAHTLVSARDAARMAVCIGEGRAAGPQWTDWVLGEMRAVRPTGRFGILPALPPAEAAQTAVKNGWIARRDGKWHVNCMAVGTNWALAVMTVYPASKGQAYGAAICRSIATQLQQ
jgi:hypothetical protein